MRFSNRAFALIMLTAAAGVAHAQPVDSEDPLGDPMPPPEPYTPPPPPPPPPQPPPAEPPPAAAPADEAVVGRPEGFSIGIGIGFSIPGAVDTPNLASVRFRLATGLTFEPFVTLGNASTTTDNGIAEQEDSETTFGAGALVRIPVVQRGKIDLEVLGSGAFINNKDNPDGDQNTVSQTSFALGYGLAVSYWLTRHWNLTLSATNGVISYNRTSRDGLGGMDTSSSRLEIKAEFAPRVGVMIHLFN